MAGRGATSAVIRAWVQAGRRTPGQAPVVVLAAALLFNLGQGVLRPTLPLYLQQVFAANYQMVTLIPLVFGIGKWVASLPTGYLLDRLERRRLMVGGLLVIAVCDVSSVADLGLRRLPGLSGPGRRRLGHVRDGRDDDDGRPPGAPAPRPGGQLALDE
jgi:hypothetical protein